PIVDEGGARIGIITMGSAGPAVFEARDLLSEAGIDTSYLRVRALPMDDTVREFVSRHDRVYVVELNYDGQLCKLVQLEVPEHAARLRSLAHCDGLPLTAQLITDGILEQER
ncbi:MAG: 2-oxoacid:acceptor oxidoreductase subunit alpha, partial [Chloroflexota bacterium]|nr:2-oxoacid:acceptor oxidoreductase subunit alpha [Chloroflexota bacterium]